MTLKRFNGALREGEITPTEYRILVWIGIAEQWRGTMPELMGALQWEHGAKYLGRILNDLRSRGLVESTRRGRAGGPFELCLAEWQVPEVPGQNPCLEDFPGPSVGLPGSSYHSVSNEQCPEVESDEVQSSKLRAPYSPSGTHHHRHCSSLIGPHDQGVDDWHAERPAPREGAPEPDGLDAELDAALGVAYADPMEAECLARFGEPVPGSFQGDERTGDTTGDDEASQLRWQGANPSKVRARRQRD